jgi:hypothetical protein
MATPPSRVLTRYQADEETPRLAGNRAAQALKELLRIRSVPAELMAQADLASGDAAVGGVRLLHADRPHQAPAGIAEALRVGN